MRALKAASPERYLRVDVRRRRGVGRPAPAPPSLGSTPRAPACACAPGADPGVVLDAVRAHAPVDDFGVEAPSLSELFLAAAGEPAGAGEDAVEADA